MADVPTSPTWLQILVSSGVIGAIIAAVNKLYTRYVDKSDRAEKREETQVEKLENKLNRAEERCEEWRAKYEFLSGEFKATAEAFRNFKRASETEHDGKPHSLPPPREEQPTIDWIIEARKDRAVEAEEAERAKQRPLNDDRLPTVRKPLPLQGFGGAQDYFDRQLRKLDGDDTPPDAFVPPTKGKR